MQQQELKLLGRLDGPSVVPTQYVKQCRTYRDAVLMCWALRRIKRMSSLGMAEAVGMPTHLRSDYLSADDSKREMPAKHIPAFEAVCGNTCVSQWLALQAKLTVIEEVQADRMAA